MAHHLLVTARSASLSAAAEEFGVAHDAISRRVHALEVWLGSPIFERHGRGVRLSSIGSNLAERIDRSL